MNSSQMLLISKIKNALRKKKLQTTIKYSYSNVSFINYLLSKQLIEGFIQKWKAKQNVLIIFLKYDFSYHSVIDNFSIVSKITKKQRSFYWIENKHQSNFVLNLTTEKDNASKLQKKKKLLARFR